MPAFLNIDAMKLAEDGLTAREVLGSIDEPVIVEQYPDYLKGPWVLLLQKY